jgi:hypothetical protein
LGPRGGRSRRFGGRCEKIGQRPHRRDASVGDQDDLVRPSRRLVLERGGQSDYLNL